VFKDDNTIHLSEDCILCNAMSARTFDKIVKAQSTTAHHSERIHQDARVTRGEGPDLPLTSGHIQNSLRVHGPFHKLNPLVSPLLLTIGSEFLLVFFSGVTVFVTVLLKHAKSLLQHFFFVGFEQQPTQSLSIAWQQVD